MSSILLELADPNLPIQSRSRMEFWVNFYQKPGGKLWCQTFWTEDHALRDVTTHRIKTVKFVEADPD